MSDNVQLPYGNGAISFRQAHRCFPLRFEAEHGNSQFSVTYRFGRVKVFIDDKVPNSTNVAQYVLDQKISDDSSDGHWSAEEANVYLTLIEQAIRAERLESLILPSKNRAREHPLYCKGAYEGVEPPRIEGSNIILPFEGGGSYPVQYEVDYQGHNYYVRYRSGWLSVTLDIDFEDRELFEQQLSSNDTDGFWSDGATNVYLALLSRAIAGGGFRQLSLPSKGEVRAHPYYGRGPYEGYDPRNSDGP